MRTSFVPYLYAQAFACKVLFWIEHRAQGLRRTLPAADDISLAQISCVGFSV